MSENGWTPEGQKQWDQRNSDRKDTFEGQLGGERTGEVRTIDHQDHPLPVRWTVAAQMDSNDDIPSDLPLAIVGVHVWPSDVSPPPEGTMVLIELGQEPESWAENGYADEPSVLTWETYAPAADGD
jgi:hypothetical protein